VVPHRFFLLITIATPIDSLAKGEKWNGAEAQPFTTMIADRTQHWFTYIHGLLTNFVGQTRKTREG